MQAFDYVLWLQNVELPPGDEDHEWPACFIVLAESAGTAQFWGDRIGHEYCLATRAIFLHSSVEPHGCSVSLEAQTQHACPGFPAFDGPANEMHAMPVVAYGDLATAEFIGW